MTDAKLIEAVARAICTACGETPDSEGGTLETQFRLQEYIPAANAAIAAMEDYRNSQQKYGCHVDLFDGIEPDDCVIDAGRFHDCFYAKPGMKKEDCEYWQPIRIVQEQEK